MYKSGSSLLKIYIKLVYVIKSFKYINVQQNSEQFDIIYAEVYH